MSVNYTPEQKNYKEYGTFEPFKMFVLQNFPFITEDFDALTYYQMLCKVVEYLKDTIENNKMIQENQNEVLNAFNELQNYVNTYFDNLNVQKEINNKLDVMVKNGELQDLLNQLYNNLSVDVDNKINNIESKIDSAVSGGPAGVYNTLADLQQENPDNTKTYLVLDDGKWYYHNGTSWISGGIYQATAIDYSKISQNIKNVDVYNHLSDGAVSGYYDNNGNLAIAMSHKCLKLDILDDNCYLDYEVKGTIQLPIGFLKYKDGTLKSLGFKTMTKALLKNVKELYFNFYNLDETVEFFTITYPDKIRINDIGNIRIPYNSIKKEFSYNIENLDTLVGYYKGDLSIDIASISHKCAKIEITNDNTLLSFNGADLLSTLSYGYLLKNDNSLIPIGNKAVSKMSLKDVKELYINFFNNDTGDSDYAKEFILSVEDEETTKVQYDDYVKSKYEFENKNLCFAGDSITRGYTTGNNVTENGYPKLFSNEVNASYKNISLGGALYTDGYNDIDTLLTQITNNTNKNVDFLFLAGGVNDCQLNVPIDEFKTAVSNTIDYALNNYSSEIIIITPISHIRPMASNVNDYINAITEVAIMKNNDRISIVQGHKFNFVNNNSSEEMKIALYGDNIHPSELGYKVYTRGLIKALCK